MDRRFLYGIAGFAGSGKDTIARTLLSRRTGTLHSFANPLKDGVAAIFGLPRNMLEGDTAASRLWREEPDAYWSKVFERPMTPRRLLQEVGTNAMRSWFSNVWVAAAGRRADGDGVHVFSDTRFRNEMEWIRHEGGIIIWVYRSDVQHIDAHDRANIAHLIRGSAPLHDGCITLNSPTHPSETAFLTEGADLIDIVIENNAGLPDLTAIAVHLDCLQASGGITTLPIHRTTLYLSFTYGKFIWRWHDRHGYHVRYYDRMSRPLDEGYDETETAYAC